MVTGVTAGYEKKLEIVGVGYRVLRRAHAARVRARLQPTRLSSTRPRASRSSSRRTPGSWCRGSTSSRSAKSPPTSASSASPSLTRARVCGYSGERCAQQAGKGRLSDGYLPGVRKHLADKTAAKARRQVRGRKAIAGTAERPAPCRQPAARVTWWLRSSTMRSATRWLPRNARGSR